MIKRSFIGYLMILNISVFNSQHQDLTRDRRLQFSPGWVNKLYYNTKWSAKKWKKQNKNVDIGYYLEIWI